MMCPSFFPRGSRWLAAAVFLVLGLAASAAWAGSISVPVTAFWDFDDWGNPLLDQTGNGHDLINPGGSSSPGITSPATAGTNGWSPNGLAGRVAKFDGGDYFAVPNSVYSGGDFTFLIAQLRPTAAGGYDTIFASSRFRYQNVNDALSGGINSPGGSFGGSYALNPDDWYLVALRYDNATRSLESFALTNTGTLGSPVLTGSANVPGLGNATNFRIGGDGTSGIGSFDGWAGELDFAVFHDGLLNNTQLQTIVTEFNSSPNVLPPPPPPAVKSAFWDFNAANPLLDRSGNGNHLVNPGGGNSPTFGPATPSANGWQPMELDRGDVAKFDGSDYLEIPNSVYAGGDFTVLVAHRRPTAAGGYDTIFASSRFRYQNINDALGGGINSPGGSFGGTYPLNPDDWYFTALRYNDTTGTLESYAVTAGDLLGGPVLVGSANSPGLGNAINWRIGGDGTSLIGGFDGWAGEIDYVAFYNQLLTDGQIQNAFANFVVPEPSAFILFALGLAGIAVLRRRRK